MMTTILASLDESKHDFTSRDMNSLAGVQRIIKEAGYEMSLEEVSTFLTDVLGVGAPPKRKMKKPEKKRRPPPRVLPAAAADRSDGSAAEEKTDEGGTVSFPEACSSDECAICLEPLSSATRKKLKCGHVYHRKCVTKLLDRGVTQTCPTCRAALPPRCAFISCSRFRSLACEILISVHARRSLTLTSLFHSQSARYIR